MSDSNASWYRDNYPAQTDVHDLDPRLIEVVSVLDTGIHNVVSGELPGGGLSVWGGDALSLLTKVDLSTYDMGKLTALVIAAHKHLCRVTVDGIDIWGRDRWAEGHEPRVDPESGVRYVDADAWLGWTDIVDAQDRFDQWGDAIPDDRRQITGYLRIIVWPRTLAVPGESHLYTHPTITDLANRLGVPKVLGGPLEVEVTSRASWNAVTSAVHAAIQPAETGMSWIACDVGLVSDPTVIAVGAGVPGIDAPLVVVKTRASMDDQAYVYKALAAAVNPNTVIFDKTGAGIHLWQLVNRR